MKVTYSGKPDKLTAQEQKKIELRLQKLAKLLDRRDGEKEARIIMSSERHLTRAEVTVNYFDQAIACVGAGADQFHAIADALDKLEKQILKKRAKWRDTKRSSGDSVRLAASPAAEEETAVRNAGKKKVKQKAEVDTEEAPRLVRVNARALRKPMSLEEAMLEMENGREFVAYRDMETDRLTVLVRRKDGNIALIEE